MGSTLEGELSAELTEGGKLHTPPFRQNFVLPPSPRRGKAM